MLWVCKAALLWVFRRNSEPKTDYRIEEMNKNVLRVLGLIYK